MISILAKQVAKGLFEQLPKMADNSPEAKNMLRSQIEVILTKMNIVSREEFDAQTAVLARTQTKLELLNKQLVELEQQQ